AATFYKREVEIRARGCEAGIGEDCIELAVNYRSRAQGVPIDAEKAKDLEQRAVAAWTAGCDAGDWAECFALRTRLEKEPIQDVKRVRGIRERECSLGYEHSCKRLGIAYASPRP